ncbi:hypothetical protein EJB05_37300, partial [Eragrostis curvula]
MAQIAVLDHLVVDGVPAAKTFLPLLFPLLLLLVLRRYLAPAGGAAAGERRKPPPSPPALPLIGHLHLVGALPYVSLRRLAARHGDLMLLRMGAVPTLVASSPRAAQAVLRTHDQSFASRPRSVVGDVLTYGFADVGFAPYGERWRPAKKLVSTHLLSAKKVQSYRAAREEVVIYDQVFKFFRVEGRDRVFRELIDAGMALLGGFNLENFYPGLAELAGGVLVWPVHRKAEKLRDRWDELLDKLIDEHTRTVAENNGGGGDQEEIESDFIDVLLSVKEEYGLTQNNIKSILADMFAAGTDTAYLVLEFTMAELMLNEDVMTKLQAEPSSRKHFVYTHRHRSSSHISPKRVVCVVDGYTIPAGTTMFVNAWAIGRDPKIWDSAEQFMPERFVHNEEIQGFDFRGKDFEYLPFGSGRRMCPGMNFGLASVEIMLANLVYHFDWELPKGLKSIDMTEVFGLTVCRKEKLFLAPTSRDFVQPNEGLVE